MIHARNQMMVKRILEEFSERPNAKTMLVPVGKDHFPGMSELLLSEGFSEVDLSEIKTS